MAVRHCIFKNIVWNFTVIKITQLDINMNIDNVTVTLLIYNRNCIFYTDVEKFANKFQENPYLAK